MSHDRNLAAAEGSPSETRSSAAAKLIQAAALAAVLVPFGTVAVEADAVTCGFGTYYSGPIELLSTGSCSGSSPSSSTFSWFDDITGEFLYSFTLEFIGLDPDAGFNITMDDQALDQSAFDLLAADVAAIYGLSYDCIPLVNESAPCRNFFMTEYPGGTMEPWDSYIFSILWLYEVGITTATVLHDIGEPDNPNFRNPPLGNGPLYDEDMCIEYDNCSFNPDPEISSGDTDFRAFTPATTQQVPEPATVLLIATGLGAVAYRRRRGRRA
jgi:hypothetical protein